MNASNLLAIACCFAVALLGAAANAQAQSYQMSVSSYEDVYGDATVYAEVAFFDESWGCDHTGYVVDASMSGPGGSASYYGGGTSASLSANAAEGNWDVSASLYVQCSCAGFVNIGYTYIDFDLAFPVTYYGDAFLNQNKCFWTDLACTSGTPTCTGGYIQTIEWGSNCQNFMKATYLAVRYNGGAWNCSGVAYGQSGQPAGQCT